jgi:putative transposase
VLERKIKEDVEHAIRGQTVQQECEVVELNVQRDHIHVVAMIPPKLIGSNYIRRANGKTAISVF